MLFSAGPFQNSNNKLQLDETQAAVNCQYEYSMPDSGLSFGELEPVVTFLTDCRFRSCSENICAKVRRQFIHAVLPAVTIDCELHGIAAVYTIILSIRHC
jgi:hypothetical protein